MPRKYTQNSIKIHLVPVDEPCSPPIDTASYLFLFPTHFGPPSPLLQPLDAHCNQPPKHMMMIDKEVGASASPASMALLSWQLHLHTHWNHLGLSRFVQIFKNSLLFISSDFNEVLLVVNGEVPLPDNLLQGFCILLDPKNCSKRSVENDIGLRSLPCLRKRKE